MVKQHVQDQETDERQIYKQNPEINAEKDAQKSNFPAGINMLAHNSDLALRFFFIIIIIIYKSIVCIHFQGKKKGGKEKGRYNFVDQVI